METKEHGIMLCPLCKEIIDIPDTYKEYFFKQGIQKAIDNEVDDLKSMLQAEDYSELKQCVSDLLSEKEEYLEKLNQEIKNGN